MNKYNDPLIIYDEIIDAIKGIIHVSEIGDGDINYITNKYDLEENANDVILNESLCELDRQIDIISEKIRNDLKIKVAKQYYNLYANYRFGQEYRKLSCKTQVLKKLRDYVDVISEDIEELTSGSKEELFNTIELSNLLEEIKKIDVQPKIDDNISIKKIESEKSSLDTRVYNKLSLINKAIKIAKNNDNQKIVNYLEKELAKELNK